MNPNSTSNARPLLPADDEGTVGVGDAADPTQSNLLPESAQPRLRAALRKYGVEVADDERVLVESNVQSIYYSTMTGSSEWTEILLTVAGDRSRRYTYTDYEAFGTFMRDLFPEVTA